MFDMLQLVVKTALHSTIFVRTVSQKTAVKVTSMLSAAKLDDELKEALIKYIPASAAWFMNFNPMKPEAKVEPPRG